MPRYALLLGIAFGLTTLSPAHAQEPPPLAAPAPPPPRVQSAGPEQPDVPQRLESGESLEPEVRLVRRRGATLEEYRVGGQVYMVRVKPVVGPAYYIRNPESEGRSQRCTSDIYCDFAVPQWVLFSW